VTVTEETRNWWQGFFGETYRLSDLDLQPAERTRQQVECVERALALPQGARVLDVGCGTGRHCVELASDGFEVVGVDRNPAYLARAQERARSSGVDVEFRCADMRELEAETQAPFDAAVSLYTSFGFFHEERENVAVLEAIRASLKPHGALLLDVINRDWLLRNFAQSDFAPRDGRFVIRDYDDSGETVVLHEDAFQPESSMLRWTIRRLDDDSEPAIADYRVYSLHELLALVRGACLRPSITLGDYDCSPFEIFAPRIICIARRDAA
jgi:SAM-dependent methyltransferase